MNTLTIQLTRSRYVGAAHACVLWMVSLVLISCGDAKRTLIVTSKIPRAVSVEKDWLRGPVGTDGEVVGFVSSANLKLSGAAGGVQERITAKSKSFVIDGGISVGQ